MTPTTKQNYSYAINEDNTLIHVNTAVRGGMYTCPYCGGEMTPHMGKIRKWHFTHKANLQNCNYETYLHKIAKARIKAAFDNNPHFIFSMTCRCIAINLTAMSPTARNVEPFNI